MKNNGFARFARAFFIFVHFADVLVPSTAWNDFFCSCVDDVRMWWKMFNFAFLSQKRWFQFNSKIVRTHFASILTVNNWEMITETQNYIFQMTFSLSSTSCLLKHTIDDAKRCRNSCPWLAKIALVMWLCAWVRWWHIKGLVLAFVYLDFKWRALGTMLEWRAHPEIRCYLHHTSRTGKTGTLRNADTNVHNASFVIFYDLIKQGSAEIQITFQTNLPF